MLQRFFIHKTQWVTRYLVLQGAELQVIYTGRYLVLQGAELQVIYTGRCLVLQGAELQVIYTRRYLVLQGAELQVIYTGRYLVLQGAELQVIYTGRYLVLQGAELQVIYTGRYLVLQGAELQVIYTRRYLVLQGAELQVICTGSSACMYHCCNDDNVCFRALFPPTGRTLYYDIEAQLPKSFSHGCVSLTHRGFLTKMVYLHYISRVSDQKGVSLLYIMLEIHHSGWKPSISCLRYTILVGNPHMHMGPTSPNENK